MASILSQILRRKLFTHCIKTSIPKKVILPCSTYSTFNEDRSKTNKSLVKYLFYLFSGVVGYSYVKNKSILPSVEAAKNLSGKRNNYGFIADVVEQAAPTVVYIEIKDTRRLDFFTGRPSTASNGSGFIIDANGLIVTNAHVVVNKPNAKVEVRLHDGATYTGVVEDVDMQSDLATVRIQARNLPVMKLGKSSDMRPGEFVVAMGSPLSLSNTVTAGVISSTSRGSNELGLRGKDMVYLQTDAAITFGNSGGPLINLDGEAIGVNSMKVTAGISFAIPIDYVKSFLERNKGTSKTNVNKSERRYMGITMLTLTPEIILELHQRNHNIPPDVHHGILVWKVIIGSPAHVGGLQPGDIVTAINKKPMTHVNEIYEILGDSNVRLLQMSVVRDGHRLELKVTPEDAS